MRIDNPTQLKHGMKYWYLSVGNCCHFPVRVLSEHYDSKNGPQSLYGMLRFDDEDSARKLANQINQKISPIFPKL